MVSRSGSACLVYNPDNEKVKTPWDNRPEAILSDAHPDKFQQASPSTILCRPLFAKKGEQLFVKFKPGSRVARAVIERERDDGTSARYSSQLRENPE